MPDSTSLSVERLDCDRSSACAALGFGFLDQIADIDRLFVVLQGQFARKRIGYNLRARRRFSAESGLELNSSSSEGRGALPARRSSRKTLPTGPAQTLASGVSHSNRVQGGSQKEPSVSAASIQRRFVLIIEH